MGFVQAIKSCIRNCADFQGRGSRSEYWYLVLGVVLIDLMLGLIDGVTGSKAGVYAGIGLMALAIFLPSLAAQLRRLHDTNACGR